MQVNIEDVSPVEKKLAVEIPWERVREKLDLAYRELGRGAEIRGFRRGKVPRPVLERMFGKKVQEEVAKELVQETFIGAAEEHKLDVVAEPVVEVATLKSGEPLRYTARVEVRQPVELKQYEGLTGARHKVVVADQDVEHALEHTRLLHTTYRPIEGRTTTAATDVLIVSMKGKVGEHDVDRPELSVDLGETEHEPLPGLVRALTGVPLDAKDLEVKLDFPADARQKEIAGKSAALVVSVREAREKVVPSLDDEFAKDTGDADTLDELRVKLRADLERRAREATERELRNQLVKDLVKANPVELPPSLIERGIDTQLSRFGLSLAMQGIELGRDFLGDRSMRERVRDGAAEELRGQLVLDAIADKEKIEIGDADVDARVARMAAEQGKPASKLKAEMEREGSLRALRWSLRQEKALDLVVSRATITEVEPGAAATAPASAGEEQTP